MKKVLALATVLCLAFALCLTSSASAALPEGWEILDGSGIEFGTNINYTEEGYLEIDENANGNHIGIVYTKELPDSYTVEVDVFIPGSVDPFIGGGVEPIIAIGASSYGWPGAAAFVYRMHAYTNSYGYAFGQYGVGPELTQFISGTESTVPEWVVGGWNTVKFVVDAGYMDFYLNGNLKVAAIELAGNGSDGIGEYILLGQEKDNPTDPAPTELPKFRNVRITTAAGTEVYFNSPYVPDTADIEVIAIAGSMIAMLIAAAFVIKARKA